jgi:hypothetical protein
VFVDGSPHLLPLFIACAGKGEKVAWDDDDDDDEASAESSQDDDSEDDDMPLAKRGKASAKARK